MSVRFLRLRDVPGGPKDLICREDAGNALLWAGLWLVIFALGIILPIAYADMPRFGWNETGLLCWALFWVGLLALLQVRRALASLKNSNWLLKGRPDGLYVKYRSFLNHRHPQDDQAVAFIPRRNIAWIRAFDEEAQKPVSSDSDRVTEVSEKRSFLDIRLKHTRLAEFQERLKFERHRFSKGTTGGHHNHFPVRIIEPDVVRIDWDDARGHIHPILEDTIGKLRKMAYAIAPRIARLQQGLFDMPAKEQEDRLIDLIERGDDIGAVMAAKNLYDFDTTEAKAFIDRLHA